MFTEHLDLRVKGSGLRAQGSGLRAQGIGYIILVYTLYWNSSGLGHHGLGFRVQSRV
jgi:hypothetical protein